MSLRLWLNTLMGTLPKVLRRKAHRFQRPGLRSVRLRFVAFQQLEDRMLLAAVPFTFAFDDPNNEFAPFPSLLSSFQAAGQILSSMLDGQGSMDVRVRADNSVPRTTGGTV